jgi:uncharacterized protein
MISIEEARQYYQGHESSHDFDHVLRVLALAERIARAEGGDLEVVRAAALLHDIGRAEEEATGGDHAAIGAARAREILAGHPPEKVEAVAAAIASHRFRSGPPPATPEARALFDADKLDAMGAIGVARAFARAGAHGQRLWVPPDVAAAQRDGHSRPHARARIHRQTLPVAGGDDHRHGAGHRRGTARFYGSLLRPAGG